jgi:hypothetical protein
METQGIKTGQTGGGKEVKYDVKIIDAIIYAPTKPKGSYTEQLQQVANCIGLGYELYHFASVMSEQYACFQYILRKPL